MALSLTPLLLGASIISSAIAQPAIVDVVNSASRMPTGFPGAGIAQGALFSIVGTGLGPDPFQVAAFPLPTTGGLAGVSVQVVLGGRSIDAIMVLVSPTEVKAILPSATPPGLGVVTINNNGATASAPIMVVASAPGLFPVSNVLGLDGQARGYGLAFNVSGDGTTPFNFYSTPARPNQSVVLAATGVGAITSDETQSGVADVPSAQLQVWIGNLPATNVSASRGSYPSVPPTIDLSILPDGIAAIDLIQFTVPDGIFGCLVTVVVQTGSFYSNPVTIAISPDGSACVDPTAVVPGDTVTFNGTARIANITLQRTVSRTLNGGVASEIAIDVGIASFLQYDVPTSPLPVSVSSFASVQNLDPGTCTLQWGRVIVPAGPSNPPLSGTPQTVTYLDAGDALNLTGPHGTMQLKKDGQGFYVASLGTSFTIPPVPPTGKLFLDPGDYVADDGAGGTDTPAFKANLTLTNPQLVFTDIDSLSTIDRTKGFTVHWTGGDPSGYVTLVGSSYLLGGTKPGSITLEGTFGCSERISAGQLTVPAFITANLPQTGLPQGLGGLGTVGLTTYVANRISLPGFDLGLIAFSISLGRSVVFQ